VASRVLKVVAEGVQAVPVSATVGRAWCFGWLVVRPSPWG